MSVFPLAETIKNTIEVLNEIYEIQNSGLQWVIFLKFSWNVIMDWIVYVFTFKWMNDFIQLPIILPQVSESIFSDLFNFLVHNQSLDPSAGLNFLTSDSSVGEAKAIVMTPFWGIFFKTSFLSGFLNCFFLYFPLSPVQFIWLRRVIIDGPWAGRAATIGIVFGHLSLLGFCLFGFRDLINTWFGLEPLSYFLGIWLIFTVIFEMAHSPFRILKKYQRKELLKIFLINFGLVWTDQSGLYQFFGNLSLHSGVSPIDFSFYNSDRFVIPFYFFGIIIGSIFWTYLISQGILHFGYLFPRITQYKYPYSYWIRGFHYFCLISCITLTLTSFPYYGPDYLFTNPLGFFPQDNVFEATSILKTDTRDTKKGRLGEKSSFASIDTDLSLFDRGRYAGGPVVEFHIESLNYQEEYAWRSRFDRLSSRGLTRGGGGLLDQYLTTQLGPVEEALKKQRREKKRAQQIQKFANFSREIQAEKDQKNELDRSSDVGSIRPLSGSEDQTFGLPYGEPQSVEALNRFVDQSPNDLMDDYEYLIERFVENYTAEANTEDSEVPNLVDEKMIHFSAFSEIAKYGFDVFSMFEAVELDPVDEELAKEIKEKFSENLVYRFLVNCDISNFLKRQPKEHKLTSQDEISLFEKRLALAEYYDTLRSYSHLPAPFSDIFQPLFCGPKSYVNRIYNQQFKGTLKIVERLFSIHLEDDENIPSGELNTVALAQKETPQKSRQEEIYLKFKKDPSVLKFDQPLYKKEFFYKNPLIHEQFLDQMQSSIQEADLSPFLRDGKPLPFFVGWDNQQRKFIVTNRLLTRQKTLSNTSVRKTASLDLPGANFQISKPTKGKQKGKSKMRKLKPSLPGATKLEFKKGTSYHKKNPVIQSFQFTTWPVTEKALKTHPLFSRLYRTYDEMKMAGSADDVFKYAEPQMEEESLIYDKLPNIVQRIEMKNKLQMSLAPTRGGFIWPGNEPLKFKFTQLSQQLQTLQKWFKKDSLPSGKLSGKNRF